MKNCINVKININRKEKGKMEVKKENKCKLGQIKAKR